MNKMRPFRYWVQKVLPLVYDDSLSYYELLGKVVDYLNKLAATTNENNDTLNYYIKLFNDFMDTFDISAYVSDKLDEMAESGELEDLINVTIANYEGCICSMAAEKHVVGHLDGAAYIGNNKIVYYCHSDSSDFGMLTCFNLSTYAEEWSYSLQLYHGNTVTYNPRLNRLFVAAAFSYADPNTLLNKVLEIDLSDPSRISRVIELNRNCYSIAYNDSTDMYYVIAYRGSNPGEVDRVYTYDSSFNETGYIELSDYPSWYRASSVQGVTSVIGNRIYLLVYDPTQSVIMYDLEGKLISSFKIPTVISMYKLVTEVECTIYDFDHDIMYIGFRTVSQVVGFDSQACFMATNLRNAIIPHDIANGWNASYSVQCNNNGLLSYKPANHTRVLSDFYDATTMARFIKTQIVVSMLASSSLVKGVTFIRDANMYLVGNGCQFSALRLLNSKAIIENVNVIDAASGSSTGGKNGCIVLDNSEVEIKQCNLTYETGEYGIISSIESKCSFESTAFSSSERCGYMLRGGSIIAQGHEAMTLGDGAGYHKPVVVHYGTVIAGDPVPFNYGANIDNYIAGTVFAGSNANAREMRQFYVDAIRDTTIEYSSEFWSNGGVFERAVQFKIDFIGKTVQLLSAKQKNPSGVWADFDRAFLILAV